MYWYRGEWIVEIERDRVEEKLREKQKEFVGFVWDMNRRVVDVGWRLGVENGTSRVNVLRRTGTGPAFVVTRES